MSEHAAGIACSLGLISRPLTLTEVIEKRVWSQTQLPLGLRPMSAVGEWVSFKFRPRWRNRHNLTMRMSMRRFTRLTNAFSKKVENHAAAVARYFMYYNLGRVDQTARDASNRNGNRKPVCSVEEIVALLDRRVL